MNKEKWLLQEIDQWMAQSMIDAETANALRERYTGKKNSGMLIILFSIIGSLLIGTGIILIMARNWYSFPIFLRTALAFFPLIVSQGFAVYVIRRKRNSAAWCESVAILVTSSVFTAMALVSQIFHISNDYASYILQCGLLSLPMIYLLDASAPLIVYYWTILNWAGLTHSPLNAILLLVLFALGCGYIYLKRKTVNAKLIYMTWISLSAGFVAVMIIGAMLDSSLLLLVLCYFVLLLSVESLPEPVSAAFQSLGTIGSLVTLAILTYQNMWANVYEVVGAGGAVFAGLMLAVALFFVFSNQEIHKLKKLFILALSVLCILRYIWILMELDYDVYPFVFMLISNITLAGCGVGFIVHGTRHIRLQTTNIGMVILCFLITIRFFDSNMDFLWRGVVFLVLGAAFLLVNLRLARIKKQTKDEGVET
ncbi:MAG: DUF2157 domain-containing protein [Clostridiales bacterium]|nr:DUF2157 domain-containing protein [Clostridiales bacterium]